MLLFRDASLCSGLRLLSNKVQLLLALKSVKRVRDLCSLGPSQSQTHQTAEA